MLNQKVYSSAIGACLVSILSLSGCIPISLPSGGGTTWPISETEVKPLLKNNRDQVESQLGSPSYIGYLEGLTYTIYEALGDEEKHVLMGLGVIPQEIWTTNTVYCLLLEFDVNDNLLRYSYLRGASRQDRYYFYEGGYDQDASYSYDCLDLMQEDRPVIEWGINYAAIEERAIGGDMVAQLKLFELQRETKAGKKWLCSAADQGFAHAQVRLADIYYNGWFGVPLDHIRSYAWLTVASNSNDEWGHWAEKLLESRFKNFTDVELINAQGILDKWQTNQCRHDLNLHSVSH